MFKTSTAQVLSLQQMLSEMDTALEVEIKVQEGAESAVFAATKHEH